MAAVRSGSVLTLAFIALLATGCQAPPPATGPTRGTVTSRTPDEYELLWEAASETLQRFSFQPDRQDRAEGVMTTHPETSAHWFEWWRPQPQPSYYWAESNMHTVQRQATVALSPTAVPGQYEVDVKIERYQYSLEERQIDNPAAAMRLYSGAAPTASGKALNPKESSHWIPLGRDEHMEQAVLESILKRYGRGAGAQTP